MDSNEYIVSIVGNIGPEINASKYFHDNNPHCGTPNAISFSLKRDRLESTLTALKEIGFRFEREFYNFSHSESKEDSISYLGSKDKAICYINNFYYHDSVKIHILFDPLIKNDILEKFLSLSKIACEAKELNPNEFRIGYLESNFGELSINYNNVKIPEIKIEDQYNDDVVAAFEGIKKRLSSGKSGILFLNGKYGTGKSSLIQKLASELRTQSFVYIPANLVSSLDKPDFVSILKENMVIILEDAELCVESRSNGPNPFISTILSLTDSVISDINKVKFIVTGNTGFEDIDKALERPGRAIGKLNIGPLTKEKANNLLKKLGKEPQNKEMTVAEIFCEEVISNVENQSKKVGFGA